MRKQEGMPFVGGPGDGDGRMPDGDAHWDGLAHHTAVCNQRRQEGMPFVDGLLYTYIHIL